MLPKSVAVSDIAQHLIIFFSMVQTHKILLKYHVFTLLEMYRSRHNFGNPRPIGRSVMSSPEISIVPTSVVIGVSCDVVCYLSCDVVCHLSTVVVQGQTQPVAQTFQGYSGTRMQPVSQPGYPGQPIVTPTVPATGQLLPQAGYAPVVTHYESPTAPPQPQETGSGQAASDPYAAPPPNYNDVISNPIPTTVSTHTCITCIYMSQHHTFHYLLGNGLVKNILSEIVLSKLFKLYFIYGVTSGGGWDFCLPLSPPPLRPLHPRPFHPDSLPILLRAGILIILDEAYIKHPDPRFKSMWQRAMLCGDQLHSTRHCAHTCLFTQIYICTMLYVV